MTAFELVYPGVWAQLRLAVPCWQLDRLGDRVTAAAVGLSECSNLAAAKLL